MKPLLLSLFALHSSLFTLSAAVPLKWTVETSRAVPAQFEAYQGETLDLEAALQSYGKPLEAPSEYALYWQTNGMGNAWWSVPCVATASSPSNVLFATWSPTNDVGAKVYNCFIGHPGTIYHAAFQLRLRPSPGALPNALPLPQPVIDFAKVTVLNPPWSGGGGGGVDTNAVIDIIHKTVDGSARYTPKYLWVFDCADSYPEAAEEYYRSRGDGKVDGGCSTVRDGGFLYRNFDFPFDDRAEFVVRCVATAPSPSCPNGRYASVGVAQVGTNLTEAIVTSGKPSRWYKALPGATVDGINENGVVAEINVVGGDPEWRSGIPSASQVHPLAAVRWALDNGTSAEMVATNLAARIAFPQGWTQNFHYMVADAEQTWIVENGEAYRSGEAESLPLQALTNFRLYGDPKDTTGEGQERYIALTNGANITSQWWTLTYTADGYRASDLPGITGEALTRLFNYWESNPREAHRGETFGGITWWQTVHTSVYDITNRTLRVSVQETDDFYTFAVPSAGGVKPDAVREIAREEITPATNQLSQTLIDSTNRLYETLSDSIAGKLDKTGGTVEFELPDNTWLTLNNGYGFAGSIGTANLYGGSWQRLVLGGVTRGKFEVEEWNDISVGRVTMDPYGWEEEHLGDVLAAKRDLTNNVCTADSFTDWVADKRTAYDDYPTFNKNKPNYEDERAMWFWEDDVMRLWHGYGLPDVVSLMFYDDYEVDYFTATRSRVCTSNELYVTQSFVTNAIKNITPPPSPTLRAYDPVRQCWWQIQPVNGVLTLTVED